MLAAQKAAFLFPRDFSVILTLGLYYEKTYIATGDRKYLNLALDKYKEVLSLNPYQEDDIVKLRQKLADLQNSTEYCSECSRDIFTNEEVPVTLHGECYCDVHEEINDARRWARIMYRRMREAQDWEIMGDNLLNETKERAEKAEKERDKYKAALEKIANCRLPEYVEWAKRIASDALKDTP